MKKMPQQKPHKSKQDYGTPPEFKVAVENRFGPISLDLAATETNSLVPRWLGRGSELGEDSLAVPWHQHDGLLWLNPEFGKIGRWAKKCAEEAELGARIVMLTPASIGSEWFAEHVYKKALVIGIRPRLVFLGQEDPEPYPKDLMLSVYGFGLSGFTTWRWAPKKVRTKKAKRALLEAA